MKIVINACYGGFSISKKCAEFMAARGNKIAIQELEEFKVDKYWYGYGYVKGGPSRGYSRTDADLVAAVEELGAKASGSCANLKVVEIPDGIEYYIDEYDGIESVHESHSSWH